MDTSSVLYTVNMVYAAGSKRASLVGVAGMVPELDHVLAVQRFAPQLAFCC